jgi:hypothetical protein
MLTRSKLKAGPEASGPRTDHHTTDGVGQVPASAGARSESPAPAASPIQAFLQDLFRGSDRKATAHPTEPAASTLPDPAVSDPPGSTEADQTADVRPAETQDAPAVLGSQGPSSDSNPPAHAISPSETHVVNQGVGSIISPSVENASRKANVASTVSAPASAGDEGLSPRAQTQMLSTMQGMIQELQEQQLVAMHALVESSQQCMRQEMCAALAEASAQQGPTPGPEPYEDFSDTNDSDAAGNDGTKYSTPSSSKESDSPPQNSCTAPSSAPRKSIGIDSCTAPSSAPSEPEPAASNETERKYTHFDQSPLFKKTATRNNIDIGMGFGNGLNVTGETRDQANTNALLHALITMLSKDKARPEKTDWDLSWTKGSQHQALQRFDTSVDKKIAFDLAPSPGDKQGMIALHRSLEADSLLKAFHDGMLQSAYVDERQRLVAALYTLACTAESCEQAESKAFSTLHRALQRSASGAKPVGGGSNSYTRLKQIESGVRELSRGAVVKSEDKGLHGANTADLLYLFDCSFAAATLVSNYAQFEQQFNELTFDKGNLPSATLMKMHQLVQRKTGQDSPQCWEETRGRFSTQLQSMAKDHKVLEPFVNKIADVDFANKSYEDWLQQFRAYEDNESFQNYFKTLHAGGRTTPRLQTSRTVNAVGHDPLLAGINELKKEMKEIAAVRTSSGSAGAATLTQLAAQVANLSASDQGRTPGTRAFAGFDEAWVIKERACPVSPLRAAGISGRCGLPKSAGC